MKQFNRTLVTAALPYANGPVHIGHLAGCYLPADIYVRYLRARKADVKFIGGTDEHGVPITIKAMQENVSPQDIVDKYYLIIRDSFDAMGISFDIFSRTSRQIHHETAAGFFKKMYDDGLFEEKESEQYFDEIKQVFLADRYIIGTCPKCGNPGAYGDQCERCGSSLSPDELINPRSALSDAVPVKKKTKHWYMPLQNYEPWLKQYIIEDHKEWKNNVYGQCKSWLDNGLQSRAMTRDSNWGIKVPLKDAEGKVLYVWFDAPIGYISATRELTDQWEDYWCREDSRLIHFIGKDNIVFHCIIFPAMLKGHGGYVVPDNVPANEFLNIEGEKVSTSRNWAVWVHDYVKDFPDQQDVLRYVLCATAPETKDNDFTWKDFQDRNNNELVANLGNFVNRTMVLMHKLCGGKVPPMHAAVKDATDDGIFAMLQEAKTRISESLETFRFRDALNEVMNVAREGNRYLQEKQPWILAKTPELQAQHQQQIDNCLHVCLQLTANLAIFINPFMPFTAKKICHMLKVVERLLEWENAGSMKLVSVGYSLRPPELLFKKIEDDQVKAQVDKLHAGLKKTAAPAAPTAAAPAPAAPAAAEAPVPEAKPQIQYDDFAKLDLKVGTITQAEKVEKADKLLKLTVDLGAEQRTVVSGIAMHFLPEEIVGKQVTLVANLAPRKMRGIESQGMILMAEDKDGRLVFVNPDNAVTPGSGVS
ncbi:methionine--tRNA ligase [Chitinophaga sp. XS-30]|uniref:methionine--tRNA ligase n=1 Tax=Chitinophaga sp. XS-30 TaxID=2604421 RepID=UPI0011DD7601|nr:methionine--tRNA ligase [Chitinophaga sp. XS-30]QEH40701.1 methionine--tRNA ligase [Chitinophaga sp. XS-30]